MAEILLRMATVRRETRRAVHPVGRGRAFEVSKIPALQKDEDKSKSSNNELNDECKCCHS
jgi:hypothetical protein